MTNKFTKGYADPQFCIITPTAYLSEYAVKSPTHLTLAHLVDTDSEYVQFYKGRSEAGDRIIMDCSAFELGQSYEPSRLVALAKSIKAHAVVLPDYPFQPARVTIDAAIKWIPYFKGEGFETFYVPQSSVGDLDDWMVGYEWAAENDNIDIIGMSILGIPNALPHIPKAYARVVLSEMLIRQKRFAFHKHHHYLGLNAGPNVEIPALLKMNALDTIDSSNPVWSGINGIRYDITRSDWMGVEKKYLREVDFAEHFSNKDHIHEAISTNVNLTLGLFDK